MANKLAIIVENPGAKQLWAMNPNLSSARQMTSSPRFQSQLGMFSKYAYMCVEMYVQGVQGMKKKNFYSLEKERERKC
jgi:hypothetical protein